MQEELSQDAISHADEVIGYILKHSGHDYGAKRLEIANLCWSLYHYWRGA